MNLFLHVKIVEDRFRFSAPLQFPGVICTDIDNFSDAPVIDTCLKAIDNAEKLVIYFEVTGEYELGSIMRLFNKMVQYKNPMKIVCKGEHEVLKKLLGRFKAQLDSSGDEVAGVVRMFFKVD